MGHATVHARLNHDPGAVSPEIQAVLVLFPLLARNTMDRSLLRYRYLLTALALAAVLVPAAGCTNFLTLAVYMIKGTDSPAEFDCLKGKRVVVVCQPMAELEYRSGTAPKDLAREVANLLKANVKKIEVVDQREVDQWIDEHSWDEYAEIGHALKAEMVLGLDVEDFRIHKGQTLYQGSANVTMHVIDCSDGDKEVVNLPLPQSVYPPSTGIPTTERQENQFRREFVLILADQIARHFYRYDHYKYHALDAAALK